MNIKLDGTNRNNYHTTCISLNHIFTNLILTIINCLVNCACKHKTTANAARVHVLKNQNKFGQPNTH